MWGDSPGTHCQQQQQQWPSPPSRPTLLKALCASVRNVCLTAEERSSNETSTRVPVWHRPACRPTQQRTWHAESRSMAAGNASAAPAAMQAVLMGTLLAHTSTGLDKCGCARTRAVLVYVAAVCCQHQLRLAAGQPPDDGSTLWCAPLELLSLQGRPAQRMRQRLSLQCRAPTRNLHTRAAPGSSCLTLITSALPMQVLLGAWLMPLSAMFSRMSGSTTALSVIVTRAPSLAASRPARPGPEPSSMSRMPV